MPGYFDDDRVLQVIVEDIEHAVGPRRVVGKDNAWWRALSDAMWNMIDVEIAVDVADSMQRADRRAERVGQRP
ncbi:MAG: hypothetical protein WD939_03025 [Dehalococcoidia bacterium]